MLGLPKAFENAGAVMGCILLIIFASLSGFGLYLLASSARLCNRVDDASFRAVAEIASPRFSALIDAAVAIKCFGVATSYLIVVGDAVPRVIGTFSRNFWIILSTIFISPLCLLDKLDGLKFTSALSLLFVAYLTGMIITYRFSYGHCGENCMPSNQTLINLRLAKTMTIFVFGFTCHQNIFSVVTEIKRPTSQRISFVIFFSLFIACSVYIAVAWSGYHTFGKKVQGDILDNYNASPAVDVARLFVAALVAFSYPLQCHPSRNCFLSLLDQCFSSNSIESYPPALLPQQQDHSTSMVQQQDQNEELSSVVTKGGFRNRFAHSRQARRLTTLCFLFASLLIALSVESLTTVLAIVGATGSTMVSYVLPGGIYYRLAPPSLIRSCALALFCLGLFVMPTAVCLIFVDID